MHEIWNTGRIAENGHPEYYRTTGLDTLLVLEVRIDGEHVTFREAIPTFAWIDQYGAPENRESFLTYWIRKHVGMLADDPHRLARLREKLLVAEPGGQHDYYRCKLSLENALMFIRCEGGTILRTPPILGGDYGDGLDAFFNRRDEMGACPCRCHDMQRQAHGGLPRMLRPEEYFREARLTEEEALRDA